MATQGTTLSLAMVLGCPDSKVHGANMGSIWGRKDPGGPHVGSMNFAIWVVLPVSVSVGSEPLKPKRNWPPFVKRHFNGSFAKEETKIVTQISLFASKYLIDNKSALVRVIVYGWNHSWSAGWTDVNVNIFIANYHALVWYKEKRVNCI